MIYLLAVPLIIIMYFILGFLNPCSRGLVTKVALIEIGSNGSKKKYILKKFKEPVLKQYYYDDSIFTTSDIPKCDNVYVISKDGTLYKYKYKQQVMVKATERESMDLIDSTPIWNFIDLYNNYAINKFVSNIAESIED